MNTKRISPNWITQLEKDEIFVFGSNLSGYHGGGAAAIAHKKFGAVWGQGVGLQGQTYAIPTMQGGVETIKPYVDDFLMFAKTHPKLKFLVTEIGCGIAGFTVGEIAPLFKAAFDEDIENVYLPESFYLQYNISNTEPIYKKCPKGHIYSSDLEECPYCKGKTIDEELENLPQKPHNFPKATAMCYRPAPSPIPPLPPRYGWIIVLVITILLGVVIAYFCSKK